MDTEDEVVEIARRLLSEGHGLDAVLKTFEKEGLSTLPLIRALRSVTGLGLQEASRLLQAYQDGRSLVHMTEDVLQMLQAIPPLRGEYGHWIRWYFFDAVLAQTPWLTMVPGGRDPALGVIHFWWKEHPGKIGDPTYGSLSGPGIDFESFRVEMTDVVRSESFFRRYVSILEDTPGIVTCRFDWG